MERRDNIWELVSRTNTYAMTRPPSEPIDAIIQRMVVQGLSILAAAAILWSLNEIAKWTRLDLR